MNDPEPPTTGQPMTRIRLDAQVPSSEHRDHLLVALRDVLGNCTIDEVGVQHDFDGAGRIEWTRSHQLVLYIQPNEPRFDLMSVMGDACDLADVTTLVVVRVRVGAGPAPDPDDRGRHDRVLVVRPRTQDPGHENLKE